MGANILLLTCLEAIHMLNLALQLIYCTFRLSGSEEWSALAYVTASLQLTKVTAEAVAAHAKKEHLTIELGVSFLEAATALSFSAQPTCR